MDDVSQAGRELAKHGSAKGGQARAASLTSYERSSIAASAAAARWSKDLPVATHMGELVIADRRIACAVLADGRRVLTQETFLTAVGRARKAKGGTGSESGGMPPFVAAANLQPFVSDEVRQLAMPIPFRLERGGRAWGYEARLLPLVCEVYLQARDADKDLPSQKGIVATCDLLMRGLAAVGIIALVDEATGFQQERAKDELQRILSAYIAPELLPWTKRFPDEFFEQVYRLYGWNYRPGSVKRPAYVGHFINKYIYEQLPDGVLAKLREVNPTDDSGRRRHKHHQHLSADTGNPHLDRQVVAATTLMRVADSKSHFDDLFERAYPPAVRQGRLPLVIEVPSATR